MKAPKRMEHSPPVTYWCISASDEIYPVSAVAESEHCLWLMPEKRTNWRGQEIQPRMRVKRALPTHHSFQEAKDELIQRLLRAMRLKEKEVEVAMQRLDRARNLAPPMAPADA